ncbi:UDP-N-acetylmuramate dehydrogenase [Bacteroides sp. 51]|uniref:UDP-N-acetylmuramate dehydrogenase n=1 Tax=Bacteroides sp. 51 TaxID=2302938 RepID=UPI0013D2CB3E|nr:UDP-N-acetylmuramate dehydrogenase [Bacteroides sp. 51]NDV84361.1 UDP-N-acetylmuramate dehydrogenase [Bacteroides sp. 51]
MITEKKDFSLLHYNTFGIDVTTSRFIEYDTIDELKELISGSYLSEPFLHIGGGSNLLFLNNYEGTVLHSCIKTIEVVDETPDAVWLKVGSGVVWDDFVDYCVKHNLYGAENLSIIPGEVGASAVQNVGAYGVEAKDLITEVHTINPEGEERIYSNADCKFAYRYSIFKEPSGKKVIVTHVCFRLSKQESYTLDYGTIRKELEKYPAVTLETVREIIIRIRESKLPDPAVLGNAGSFFMNPVVSESKFEEIQRDYPSMPFYVMGEGRMKIPAAWLIEQSGWKGRSLGPAAVHDKQALVLVNKGGATGRDIIALSDAVRLSVREKFGIDIHPEVKTIN